jgi:U3 small nucleolar RNA-associated protein 18
VLAPHIAAGVPPKPLFTSMHLTTGISQLAFSPGAGEVLAIGSQRERDSFKLVHTRSGKAFSNWPSSSTPLHYVTSTSFSPNSGYIAVGNDKGRVLLYRLNHYAEA